MEPITRTEMYLSKRENLPAPITREERFLAKLAGMDVVTPTPITREEMFLDAAAENGGGSGGSSEDWIGDGNTHIWITLQEGRTSPMLGVCPNGTVTVDWGDGTTPDTLSGTKTTVVKWTPVHNYAKPGDYIITLTVDGEIGFYCPSSGYQYPGILRYSSESDARNYVYQTAIRKVEIGKGVPSISDKAFASCYSLTSVFISESVASIGASAFNVCHSLKSVVISEGVKSIGNNAFYCCYSLKSVTIPGSVTSIGSSAFTKCYSLTSMTIPGSVASIGSSAFFSCCGMCYYDFTSCTSIPTLGSSDAFYEISTDCEIRVPAALYDGWIAATNWTSKASQIVAV